MPKSKEPSQNLTNPHEVFKSAHSFNEATGTLIQGLISNLRKAGPGAHNLPLVMPTAAYAAFAIELYLKCLALLDGKIPPRDHNLKELFEVLNQATKVQLTAYTASPEPRQSGFALHGKGSKFELLIGPIYIAPIEAQLEAGQIIFQQFRYIYYYGHSLANGFGYMIGRFALGSGASHTGTASRVENLILALYKARQFGNSHARCRHRSPSV